jgi:hypothetical protein
MKTESKQRLPSSRSQRIESSNRLMNGDNLCIWIVCKSKVLVQYIRYENLRRSSFCVPRSLRNPLSLFVLLFEVTSYVIATFILL